MQLNNCFERQSWLEVLSIGKIIDNNVLQIAQTAVTTGTRMFVNSLARERYPINYIYGFDSEGFSYFLTSQMRHTSPSPYHSKLVRVCHDDSDYYSYTEIPIQCIGKDGTDYSLVQVNIKNAFSMEFAENQNFISFHFIPSNQIVNFVKWHQPRLQGCLGVNS